VNICSQHEHQVILNADNHVDILDEFGGLLVQRSEYQTLYAEHQAIKTRLDDLRLRNRKKLEQEEFLRFKLREIREADIKPGEESALQEEKNILSHAQKLMEYASRSYEALYGRTGSILGELKIALQDVREIKRIDSSIALSPEALDSLFFQLEDTALVLRNYLGRITFDPERLSEIDDRLEQIVKLKRKYGGTVDNILKAREETETELSEMASMEEDIARTEQEQLTRKKALIDCADRLTEARRTTAKALKTVVEVEIRALKMADAQFGVDMTQVSDVNSGEQQLTAKGADIVEFRLSANKGEVLKPLTRIASGGELSRIILAMKKALAKTGSVSTIIFDEVDSGIGGAVAEVVGEKLKEVSRHHQVICITHLPQIACFGDSHYLVSKSVSADRTNSRVELLSESQRECEIARMLGGRELTQKTAEHAREMLMKRNPEKPAKNDGHKKKIRSKERITKD
jgi:DNA repair protein RecN (Recombination protein N)